MYLKKRLYAAQIIENSGSSQNVLGRGQMLLERYHMAYGDRKMSEGVRNFSDGITKVLNVPIDAARWCQEGVKQCQECIMSQIYSYLYLDLSDNSNISVFNFILRWQLK